ncbi:hypothetical protein EVJ50_00910 [Synechococcus sp. RSCCF101]|uniref:hypothetical protein n=1 Tax=Synechococcus sp. RSCCF101 TaxID=2511069 RepID=UPI001244F610|nr:hypothetical protein [Synechococcus sp. RSCCF101]QEY31028.1 hypothetical protein EVJ50_00910 [Synechococcus sp. RSCCF101]
MSCERCGSWSVKRDRSLGGRMVCGRCGHPLSGGRRRQRAAARGNPLQNWRPAALMGRPWALMALILLLAGAGLALMQESPSRRFQPLRQDRTAPGLLS